MVTLCRLLMPPEPEITDRIRDVLRGAVPWAAAEGVAGRTTLGWPLMAPALARQLARLLDIDLGDVLVGAWNKSFTLRQQLQKSAKDPGKDMFVQLAEHKIKSEHAPHVAIVRDGQELARLGFKVSLELTLQGAVVRILDGRIQEIQTGKIKGRGTIACAGATIVDKELKTISIPGTMKVPAKPAAA